MKINVSDSRDILLVDDDHDFHFIFKYFFKKNKNISNKLINLYSGQECLDYLRERIETPMELPSIVLMDINMPGMLGFECVEEIRKIPEFKLQPSIIMFSSSSYSKDMEKALESGANRYIEKPNDLKEMQFEPC